MVSFLLRFRFLAAVVVIIVLVHAIGLLVLGATMGYKAYTIMAQGPPWTGEDRPGIHIAESVDALLFAIVLMILALGTANLFLTKDPHAHDKDTPMWMRVESFLELKLMLWEAILLVLVMATMTSILPRLDHLDLNMLILPGVIVLLAGGLFLVRRSSQKGDKA